MIYITGDTHGYIEAFKKIEEYCKEKNTTTNDYLIVLGDAGLNYFGDWRDARVKKVASKIPVTILCIHGNHEMRPETIPTYKEKEMFGSTVYIEDEHPNIVFLKDGETYTIENKTFLVIGGAYSVDKFYRLSRGYSWFPDEQISIDKRETILKNVAGKSFDYVLTHTCPYEWEPIELFLPGLDQSTVDNSTEHWLSEVKKNIDFKCWYFGHFHGNKCKPNEGYCMLFEMITELGKTF